MLSTSRGPERTSRTAQPKIHDVNILKPQVLNPTPFTVDPQSPHLQLRSHLEDSFAEFLLGNLQLIAEAAPWPRASGQSGSWLGASLRIRILCALVGVGAWERRDMSMT